MSIVVATATLTAMPSAIATPPVPTSISACAIVTEGATAWYTYNANSECFTGSTAKAMQMWVAVKRYRSDPYNLTQSVGMSQRAIDQACTCLGAYLQGGAPDQSTVTQPGETFATVNDLFDAVAMSAAEGTVTMAEFIAALVNEGGSYTVATTDQQSIDREKQFVQLMNNEAAALGMTHTVFANEHGGDAPLPGLITTPHSSPRDMAKLWTVATKDPMFVQHMGLRSIDITTMYPIPGAGPPVFASHLFQFRKAYGYYPGVIADKNGSSTGCITCRIANAKRLGRTLVADIMQTTADRTDIGTILNYAFHRIFNPIRSGWKQAVGPKTYDLAIDCRSAGDICVTADARGGGIAVRSWGIDAAAGSASQHAAAFLSPTTKGDLVPEVDIAWVGDITPKKAAPTFAFATMSLANGQAMLRLWRIPSSGHPVEVDESDLQNVATDIQVQALSSSRLITGNRRGNGKLELRLWGIAGKTLKLLDSKMTGGEVKAFDIAPSFSKPFGFVTAIRTSDDHPKVILWKVVDYRGAGTITRLGDESLNELVTDVSVAHTTARQYSMPVVEQGGKLAIYEWRVEGNDFSLRGGMGPYTGTRTKVEAARVGTGGVIVASRLGGALQLNVYGFVDEFNATNGHNEDYFEVGVGSAGKSSNIDIAPVGYVNSTNEYVVALRTSTGKLKLIMWTVGKSKP